MAAIADALAAQLHGHVVLETGHHFPVPSDFNPTVARFFGDG